ncbi:MAG: hypothetical protein OEQ28_10125, partial [Acidobacteriota bacterium]|nr:hypothetical protein [Acidobacteriota bacterium]
MSLGRVFKLSLFVAVFLFGTIAAFGQTGTIGGLVFKTDAEGNQIPVEGVRIDCYRTDIKQGCRSVNTGKDGRFVIVGLPYGSTVILGVSGPGLAPTVVSEKKVGLAETDRIGVPVEEGNGSVPTEEAVREAAAGAVTGELTEEQKKAQAELEKKRKEIEERNQRIEEINKQQMQLLKEGKEAFEAKDYGTAVVKFTEGYELDPEFVGSAPTFLNNVAMSHKAEAVVTYNEAVKTKQSAAIAQARAKVAESFIACLTATLKAHDIASNAKPGTILDPEKNKNDIKTSEDLVKESFRILGQLKLNLAGYVGTQEEADASVALYKSSLEFLPNNPDVL